jgi:hypothetical protein
MAKSSACLYRLDDWKFEEFGRTSYVMPEIGRMTWCSCGYGSTIIVLDKICERTNHPVFVQLGMLVWENVIICIFSLSCASVLPRVLFLLRCMFPGTPSPHLLRKSAAPLGLG